MKKVIALMAAALLFCGLMTGCTNEQIVVISGSGEWFEEEIVVTKTRADGTVETNEDGTVVTETVPKDNTVKTDEDGTVITETTKKGESTQKGQSTTTTKQQRTKTAATTVKTKPGRVEGADEIKFTAQADAGADYTVKGSLKISVDTVRATDYAAMFDILKQLYPNITIEYDYWQHSSADSAAEYLSKTSQTGTMADIIWDDAGEIPGYLQQGWVRPITAYVNKDPEYANVPTNLKVGYTFGGNVYAVPHQATFETMGINLDLLTKLNLSKPGLEWSAETLEKMLKSAANTGYSSGWCVGIEDLFFVGTWYGGYSAHVAGKNLTIGGYNYNTKQCDDISYYTQGALKFRDWRVMTSGVEGWQCANEKVGGVSSLTSTLGISDYTQLWAAGKALFKRTGTYETPGWTNLKFNWVEWTMPNKDGAMPFHVDHCFITTNCSDADMNAAFQVLRFISYSTNGNLARLTMYDEENAGKYILNSHIYYPTTTSKKVAEKYNSLACANEVDKYLLANIDNCYRIDPYKIVPEWKTLQNTVLGPALNAVTDGLDSSGSGFAEARAKMNTGLKKAWSELDKALK